MANFNWPINPTTVNSGPNTFVRNGVIVTVTEDTGTPSNNIPLPVKLTSVTGDINITAGDLNVNLSDQGANADVTKIGDGTNRLGITASSEAKTNDASANTTLTAMNGKMPALSGGSVPVTGPLTDTQLRATAVPVSGTFWQATQPVSAASLPLPTGAATESTLSAQSAKLPATLGQKAMAASMAVVIASDQASIPVAATLTAETTKVIGTVNLSASQTLANVTTLGTITNAVPTKAPVNTSGSNTDSTVSTVATLTAPANSVGFILMNLDTSSANIRWRVGATATSSSGQQLQAGRDTGYIPCAANISICAESGTQNYNVQWILSA